MEHSGPRGSQTLEVAKSTQEMTVISSYKILQNWNLVPVNAPRGEKSSLRPRSKAKSGINK